MVKVPGNEMLVKRVVKDFDDDDQSNKSDQSNDHDCDIDDDQEGGEERDE